MVWPTPARFLANTAYTPMDNTPLLSKASAHVEVDAVIIISETAEFVLMFEEYSTHSEGSHGCCLGHETGGSQLYGHSGELSSCRGQLFRSC